MAVHRFEISSNKKSALLQQQKREIAGLLAAEPQPKEEKARIRAESMIREDNTIEAYEILQLSCELLAERLKLISSMSECPPDLVPAVSTLMWASNRVDIPELAEIRNQFKAKYGKQFEEDAMMNAGAVVNERVFAKLSVQPPSQQLVQAYLHKIAQEYDVHWEPAQIPDHTTAPLGYSVSVAQGSGLGDGLPVVMGVPTVPTAPSSRDLPHTSQENDIAYVPPPTVPEHDDSSTEHEQDNKTTGDSSYDDLKARFNNLKR